MIWKVIVFGYIVMSAGCSSLPKDFDSVESYSYTDTAQTTLGIEAARATEGNEPGHSTMHLISEGTDAFLMRMVLMSMAERSIDVQYFIWKSDLVGKLMMHNMIVAADRGVRVRMLLDDVTLDSDTRKIIFAMDRHPNIQVRIYNPFSSSGGRVAAALTDTSRVNRRMHNKSFTVDGQYTIVGGRNIENNYFSANTRSNYADLDIVAVGPMVKEVGEHYDIYWNSSLAVPADVFSGYASQADRLQALKLELSEFADSMQDSEYALDLKDSDMYKRLTTEASDEQFDQLYRGEAHVIYDSPEKTLGKSEFETTYMISLMRPHVERIEGKLELISPYFVPGVEGRERLIGMVDSGIKVRVITNSLASTDGIMAQSGYARHRIELLKGGVELYELKPKAKSKASRSLRRSAEAKSALHAKTYIFDRKEVYIGSFNFDPRSANINTELGVICEVPEMASDIAVALFDEYVAKAAYRLELVIEDENIDGVIVPMEKVIWVETVDGKEIRHSVQPETSAWRRFNLKLYTLLPIESQL
jgi:putative cardiolipin synthase